MYYLFLIAAALSVLLTGPLLFLLRRIKARQVEREEGPSSHKSKSGTPTMGGIAFLLVIALLSWWYVDLKYMAVVLLAGAISLIGLSDDLIKVVNRHNLGLTFWQKIILQTAIAVVFSAYLLHAGLIEGPFWVLASYFLFWCFIIVGAVNATNLTDGLDGLLAGCSVIAFISFALILYKQQLMGGSAMCFISAGALFGFLFYNLPRARLFMGDVGSLAVGAIFSGLAIMSGNEWLFVLFGGVFVCEALSVIIQVGSFKFFKRRVFRMSPLHHHFELLGLSETAVVLGFWAVQLMLGILGVILA
ncbi:MAG TPA: phospho-N-acetylmuramoyl-pentapeptide-transferase [Candidatus Omnitrophota bacterium]|nr:phospho-N-acetylmuramoyl-pentapeptide-transferase [Candidatus Omnitrophota bacterium]